MTFQNLLAAQKEFFLSGQTIPLKYRLKQLKKLKKALLENERYFYEAVFKDFGKSKHETYATEFSVIYDEIDLTVRKLSKWIKPKKKKADKKNLTGKTYVSPEPYGSILIVSSWSYPFLLSLIPVISAFAAGNSLVLKPNELSFYSSGIIAKILNRIFIPEIIHVAVGGPEVSDELLKLNFDKIFFTESIALGKVIYQPVIEDLSPGSKHFKGKNPTVVLPDAKIKKTAKQIVTGKFLNAGQTLTATDFILVDKKIETKLLEELKNQIIIQFPDFDNIPEDYVQIINDQNFERLINLIDPEKVFSGGIFNKKTGLIQPTVLHKVKLNDPVTENKIFGPILPVIAFENLDNMIKELKQMPHPFALYIFSKNKKTAHKVQKEISSYGAGINDGVVQCFDHNLTLGEKQKRSVRNYNGYEGFNTLSRFKKLDSD